MKINQIIVSILFVVLRLNQIFSQTTFNIVVKDTSFDYQIGDALELPSGNFITVEAKGSYPTLIGSRLLKISPQGKILLQREFNYPGFASGLVSVNLTSEYKLLLSGGVCTSGLSKLWLCTVDTSLNLIQNRIFSLENYNYVMSHVIILHNNEILCYGKVKDTTTYHRPFLFSYKLSQDLDSLHLKIFIDHPAWGLDLIERNDHKGYYFVVVGYGNQSAGNILSLDTAFNVQKIVGMPDVDNMSSIEYTDSTHLLVTGEYEHTWPSIDKRDVGILYYDTLFNLIYSKAFGKKDTEDFPAIQKNIAFSDLHSIFIGGTDNIGPYEFTPQDSWYLLNNIDTALNLNWQKYYGGDGFYTLYGILATKDSGCLMYGTFWDYHHTEKFTRYLSLIKVTKNGLLLSINDEPLPIMHEAIIYPNPGSDEIMVQTQLKNSSIYLYDITGQAVRNQNLISGRNYLNVQCLNTGIYLYKIIQNTKVLEFGKWIKK